jgi:hypothetical protein
LALLACFIGCACAEKRTTPKVMGAPLPEACAPFSLGSSDFAIEDFEDGDEQLGPGLNGAWYRGNDGTGTQTDALLASPGAPGSEGYALHSAGSGFRKWGAFIAVRLNEAQHEVCAVDVSGLRGLELLARGQGGLRVNFATPLTTPRADGGECDTEACSDYGKAIELSDDWQSMKLHFDALAQPEWADRATWEPERLVRLSFWAEQGDFDIWLDDLRFY